VELHRCAGDVLPGGTSPEKVGEAVAAAWQALRQAEVEIPPKKCQGPSRKVKFLGPWWVVGSAAIPLRKAERLQTPQSRKQRQQPTRTAGYWRKPVPGVSIIAPPLYLLSQKGKPRERKLEHKQAINTPTDKLKNASVTGTSTCLQLHYSRMGLC